MEVRPQVPSHPVPAAQADVLVVCPQHHLLALLEDLAGVVEPGVEGGLLAAPADRFDFLDFISNFHQAAAAGEKFILKISS